MNNFLPGRLQSFIISQPPLLRFRKLLNLEFGICDQKMCNNTGAFFPGRRILISKWKKINLGKRTVSELPFRNRKKKNTDFGREKGRITEFSHIKTEKQWNLELNRGEGCFTRLLFWKYIFSFLLCFSLPTLSWWEVLAAAAQQMTINSRSRRREDPIWSRTRPPMRPKSPETEPPRRVHHVACPKGHNAHQHTRARTHTLTLTSAQFCLLPITFFFFFFVLLKAAICKKLSLISRPSTKLSVLGFAAQVGRNEKKKKKKKN